MICLRTSRLPNSPISSSVSQYIQGIEIACPIQKKYITATHSIHTQWY